MNKLELVKRIAADTKMTQKDAAAVLDSALSAIVETVASGEKVQIVGFGSFERKQREARTAHDPRTGEPVELAASAVPAFRAGKAFREAVEK